jgi:hypothetical protein
MKACGAIIVGVRYLEELQALQAVNSPKGNQPMKVKPTRGRFTSSRFQKDRYRSIFAGSFPNGAFDIAISLDKRGALKMASYARP